MRSPPSLHRHHPLAAVAGLALPVLLVTTTAQQAAARESLRRAAWRLRDRAHQSWRTLRMHALGAIDFARGRDGYRRALRDTRRLLRAFPAGRGKVTLVFDLDNTLFDTRARTLQAARTFAAAELAGGSPRRFSLRALRRLASLDARWLAPIGYDGRETARRLGLASLAEPLQKHWEPYFWNPAHWNEPLVERVARLAHRAVEEGRRRGREVEIIYLTGRHDIYSDDTVAQLARHGLPFADRGHLRSKPRGANTEAFKLSQLRELLAGGHHIAAFVTESARDIAAIGRAGDLPIPTVFVDFAVQPSGAPQVAGDTPVIRVP